MMTVYAPTTELELAELISADDVQFEVRGRGSKSSLGRHAPIDDVLSMAKFTGVTSYEPEELVLEAGAATLLGDIEKLLAKHNQMLAFEPPDFSSLLGSKHSGSLGGMLATGLSGPRRLKTGAVRDHVLGVRGVSGRGEIFKAGARVVKNVTGYDMPKLMAGSFGTLAALTSVIFKVLPRPETEETLVLRGLSDAEAMHVMSQAMQSSCEVSGAAHVPGEGTYLRLEGIGVSVRARRESLLGILERHVDIQNADASRITWKRIKNCAVFSLDPATVLWRISVAPMQGAAVVSRIAAVVECEYYFDWAGGLIWLAVPPNFDVRSCFSEGHAMLFKAPAELRERAPVFQPQSPALAALSTRIKSSFDPAGKLNRGRMYGEI